MIDLDGQLQSATLSFAAESGSVANGRTLKPNARAQGRGFETGGASRSGMSTRPVEIVEASRIDRSRHR